MSTTKFLSKEVKPKRILKGLLLSTICLFLISYLGIYYGNIIDTSLREYYQSNDDVLGVEDTEPKLIGSYGDVSEEDTFVWEWDPYWYRDGYYQLKRFIEDPEYYISGDVFTLEDTWTLRNGYELSLSCAELDMEETNAADSYSCNLSYNNQVLTKDLRYEAYCNDDCHGLTNFRVFSDTYADSNSSEYVVVSEWASGSKDWISVYRLNDGVAKLLPFLDGENEEEKYYISSYSYDMYGLYSTWENMKNFRDQIELVTYFHEPSMGSTSGESMNNVEGIYEIWEMVGDRLEFKERVVDLYIESDIAHWL